MSKTQLQTNNSRLASLIDELKGKAAGGGASGGGSVETCTVIITHKTIGPVIPRGGISFVSLNEAGIVTNTVMELPAVSSSTRTVEVRNVVKNTIMHCAFAGKIISISGGQYEDAIYYNADGAQIGYGSYIFLTDDNVTIEFQTI